MDDIKFNSLIPELSVSDINKSKEFYLKLGFTIKYERTIDKFCFLELEDNQIMIEENNNHWNTGELIYPYGRGINISMSVSDIKSFYQRVVDSGIKLFLELETHEYQVNSKIYYDMEFLVQDIDGYLLRFNNK